ncbi:SVM family protein [Italian clover phyllody phytoplasma]|uniref:SVM family protein n=1 Tax=Italian clover phyllody phytoplasma TaxID=1196420 RepID=UPI00031CF483|nr:SVM family protein [Italian clover phyllody phytoplasma]
MFKLKTNLLLLNIFVLILLGLLFITNNYQVMGMGNKNSNNNEISNDEEYVLYINAEFSIQNELVNFKINDEKKDELLKKTKMYYKSNQQI